MHKQTYYPRNKVIRKILIYFGRIILPLLARVELVGIDQLPKKGPAILAGNHENIVEVVMMAIYSPAVVEFIGTGDVPIDPRFAWLANWYQFIPIKRGNLDRTAIYTALEVLKAGGVIGIFPQGGIWGADLKSARSGVAVLSHLSGAPVYPIGFGGLKGALVKMMRLKRPRLTMRVGSPLQVQSSGKETTPSRDYLERFSSQVMERIAELLPAEERQNHQKSYEAFDVEMFIQKDGVISDLSPELDEETRTGLGMLFHYPVLLNTLKKNLGLPVGCLQNFGEPVSGREVRSSVQAILAYLETDNPGFFTYRFGVDKGLFVKKGLEMMIEKSSAQEDCFFIFTPIYHYSDNGRVITRRGVDSLHPLD